METSNLQPSNKGNRCRSSVPIISRHGSSGERPMTGTDEGSWNLRYT